MGTSRSHRTHTGRRLRQQRAALADPEVRPAPCTDKRAYGSRTQAVLALRRFTDGEMHVYQCEWCSTWHVGHSEVVTA